MPKRKLSPEDEAQVASLRDRLVLTVRFVEAAEAFPQGPQIRAIIEEAARKSDLRSLRLLQRDVSEMAAALPANDREELNALLREQVGVDEEQERADLRRGVVKILVRGAVASEVERRRLEHYVEMLENSGSDAAEARVVRQLLRTG